MFTSTTIEWKAYFKQACEPHITYPYSIRLEWLYSIQNSVKLLALSLSHINRDVPSRHYPHDRNMIVRLPILSYYSCTGRGPWGWRVPSPLQSPHLTLSSLQPIGKYFLFSLFPFGPMNQKWSWVLLYLISNIYDHYIKIFKIYTKAFNYMNYMKSFIRQWCVFWAMGSRSAFIKSRIKIPNQHFNNVINNILMP